MSTQAPSAEERKLASPVRARILLEASALFYRDGIRAVSADKIIAAAGITKVTFYRYFPTKDELVVAYLDDQITWIRSAFAAAEATHPDDPAAVLLLIGKGIAAQSCTPDFRGCAFINAAAEYPDGDHPVQRTVARFRAVLLDEATRLVSAIGVRRPAEVAAQLLMLRDGAMMAGYLGDPRVASARFLAAGRALVRSGLERRSTVAHR